MSAQSKPVFDNNNHQPATAAGAPSVSGPPNTVGHMTPAAAAAAVALSAASELLEQPLKSTEPTALPKNLNHMLAAAGICISD